MWHLTGGDATIDMDRMSAGVQLSHPSLGVSKITLPGSPLPDLALLCLRGAGFADERDESPTNEYVRGRDLFAAYPANDRRSVRYEVYWRGVTPEAAGAVGVELLVSAETDSLNSDPRIDISSWIASDDVRRVVGSSELEWESVAGEGDAAIEIDSQASPGLLLYRLAGAAFSYVEMVHPIDFTQAAITMESSPRPMACSRFQLFDKWLEKGVILRARLQGLFIERAEDERRALEYYRRFSESALPLAT